MLKKLEMVEYLFKSSSPLPPLHSPEHIVIKTFHPKEGTLERAEQLLIAPVKLSRGLSFFYNYGSCSKTSSYLNT